MSEYPEHEKVKEIRHKSQAVHDFLEWLEDTKKFRLAEDFGHPCGYLVSANYRHDDLIAEFFEIDLKKFNKEKDQMVDEMGRHNDKAQRERNKTDNISG